MNKDTEKQNPVSSDVSLLKSPDVQKIIVENIHQSNSSSCTNTGANDFIKLNKQNTQQFTDLIESGEIYFKSYFFSLSIHYIFNNKNI